MAFNFFPTHSSLPAAGAERIEIEATRTERFVTVIATALAVLVVAAIAVLMGMA